MRRLTTFIAVIFAAAAFAPLRAQSLDAFKERLAAPVVSDAAFGTARVQSLEDSFQSLSLVEAHVCVTVSIFNTDNHVVNDCYTWTIAQELLVGWFCIILLCFNELMVKVKIILLTGFQLTSSKQGIDQ